MEQARKLEAEHLANHLESTVGQQLNTLATKSEQALDKLQTQLSVSSERNREYATCIQVILWFGALFPNLGCYER